MPKLVISGTPHELVEDMITIGRAPDNTIVINDPSVSSHHAQLQLIDDAYRLKDLGSTNGTRVNGIPVAEAALRLADRIRFGAVEVRYEAGTTDSQPLPHLEQVEAMPAELSAVPAGFASASPFPSQKDQKDPVRTAILAGAAFALLVFLGSMIAVLMMHAPAL
jgi:predicted component of type VI protein secretion system